MKKVYLAKSNRANPDCVSAIRSKLTEFDIEIVEHKGGSYTHDKLKECDLLIVVPDLSNFDGDYDTEITIGKGLHEQIATFRNKSDQIYVVISFDDVYNDCDCDCDDIMTMVGIVKFEDFEVSDNTDFVNYSVILLHEEISCELTSFLKGMCLNNKSLPTEKSLFLSDYKYLLINR